MLPKENRKYTYEDYMNTPEDVRVEIIDGEIYNMAPPSDTHQKISSYLFGELYIYLKGKSCELRAAPYGVFLGDEYQPLKERHCVEPDISVICDKSKIIKQGCLGSPDFIIEIVSPSTQSHDYIRKLHLYNRYGVKEYWIINPFSKSIVVYVTNGESFSEPEKHEFNDTVTSAVLEEFSIDFSELELD